MKVEVELNSLGIITNISAYSLKDDSWNDYKYFFLKAKKYGEKEDDSSKNRYLRASLLSLFSHIEAVVNDILKAIEATKTQRTRLALHKKCELISTHTQEQVPNMQVLKQSRNYISHPGGNKDDSYPFKNISLNKIAKFETAMQIWLNKSCEATSTQRFTDTKSLVSDLSVSLGGDLSDIRKI